MKFEPTRLRHAVEQLQKEHSFEARYERQVHELQTSPQALKLAEILRETPLTELSTRLETVSPSLKPYLTPFCSHPVPELRQKAIECLFYDLQHANHPTLWISLLAYHDDETTQRLAELLLELPTPVPPWTPTQTAIIKARTDSPQAALRAFWYACLTTDQSYQNMLSAISASPKLNFSTQAINDFLTHGTAQLWQQQGLSFLTEHFKEADNHYKTLACAQCYVNYAHLPLKQALEDPFSSFFIGEVIRYPYLHRSLHRTHYQAWSWFNKFVNRDKSDQFFRNISKDGEERFKFWDEYFSSLAEVTVDKDLHALFLEFDTFGVIEFGKIGNALYIYEIDDFHKVKANYRRITDLKKDIHIKVIHHRGDWKNRVRIEIEKISLKRADLNNG